MHTDCHSNSLTHTHTHTLCGMSLLFQFGPDQWPGPRFFPNVWRVEGNQSHFLHIGRCGLWFPRAAGARLAVKYWAVRVWEVCGALYPSLPKSTEETVAQRHQPQVGKGLIPAPMISCVHSPWSQGMKSSSSLFLPHLSPLFVHLSFYLTDTQPLTSGDEKSLF